MKTTHDGSGADPNSKNEHDSNKPAISPSAVDKILKYWRDPDSTLRAVIKHCMALPLPTSETGSSSSKAQFRPNRWVQTEGSFFLKLDYPTPQAVLELCDKVLKGTPVCGYCAQLYYKGCPLLTDLDKTISPWPVLEKLPPCVRLAWVRKSRRLVINYLVNKGTLKLPLWRKIRMAKCRTMKEWGLCQPDVFCQGNSPLQYDNMRVPPAAPQPTMQKGGPYRKNTGKTGAGEPQRRIRIKLRPPKDGKG